MAFLGVPSTKGPESVRKDDCKQTGNLADQINISIVHVAGEGAAAIIALQPEMFEDCVGAPPALHDCPLGAGWRYRQAFLP